MRLKIALRPSAEETLIFTVPLTTANRLVAGISLGKERRSPLERGMSGVAAKLVERVRLKIAKNRMLAQER